MIRSTTSLHTAACCCFTCQSRVKCSGMCDLMSLLFTWICTVTSPFLCWFANNRVIVPPNPRFINGQPFWWFWTQQGGLKFTFRWVQFRCWLFSSKHRRDCERGSLHYHHHYQMCVFTVRKLTWCLLNHSCFLLWLQQCPLGRVLSAPSPTSSVSGKSPEQQETPLSCGKDYV